jgi:hypothetical protein
MTVKRVQFLKPIKKVAVSTVTIQLLKQIKMALIRFGLVRKHLKVMKVIGCRLYLGKAGMYYYAFMAHYSHGLTKPGCRVSSSW